jgi:hypothetical protein
MQYYFATPSDSTSFETPDVTPEIQFDQSPAVTGATQYSEADHTQPLSFDAWLELEIASGIHPDHQAQQEREGYILEMQEVAQVGQ